MAQRHPSTPAQRAAWVGPMLAPQRDYGLVTHLSQAAQISRTTLYRWTAQVRQYVEAVFAPAPAPRVAADRTRQVLAVLVETHASERGIQAALAAVTGAVISLGTINGIIQEAERRALQWMATQAPPGARSLALDEIYSKDRRGAYLHVVDAASYAAWVAAGPLAVDADTWTLVLWESQERGLRFAATSTDGGAALSKALQVVDPHGQHGRDPWHVLHVGSQTLGRLDRGVTELESQTAVVERQAARVAAGQRPRGKSPRTDVAAHTAMVAQAQRVADGLRYLLNLLHELAEVVVVSRAGHLLDETARRDEAAALLALLAVRHNHRVFTRGLHAGFSPLQLSGLPEAPTDWLVALGYPPAQLTPSPAAFHDPASALPEAA